MEINENTRLSAILERYPWLSEELPKLNDGFKLLNTPIGKLLLKKATVADLCRRSGLSLDEVRGELARLIAAHG